MLWGGLLGRAELCFVAEETRGYCDVGEEERGVCCLRRRVEGIVWKRSGEGVVWISVEDIVWSRLCGVGVGMVLCGGGVGRMVFRVWRVLYKWG